MLAGTQLDQAIAARARVRITERNGRAKGVVGIAMGYHAAYGNVRVGFIDAGGKYTGDYTMVSYKHVELIEDEPTAPESEAVPNAVDRAAILTEVTALTAALPLRTEKLGMGGSVSIKWYATRVSPDVPYGMHYGRNAEAGTEMFSGFDGVRIPWDAVPDFLRLFAEEPTGYPSDLRDRACTRAGTRERLLKLAPETVPGLNSGPGDTAVADGPCAKRLRGMPDAEFHDLLSDLLVCGHEPRRHESARLVRLALLAGKERSRRAI